VEAFLWLRSLGRKAPLEKALGHPAAHEAFKRHIEEELAVENLL
jgi:hypothetical protein